MQKTGWLSLARWQRRPGRRPGAQVAEVEARRSPARSTAGCLPARRRPWGGVALAVAAALGAGGCQGGLGPPVNLQVAISTGVGNDEVVRRSLDRLASQIAGEFMRIHPNANLHLRFLPEAELVASVRSRGGLGAGPDLLILRPAPLLTFKQEGLLQASNLGPEDLDPLHIQFLSRFRDGQGYVAVPFLLQPSVACFDRRRVPSPPTNLNQLVELASTGVRVGLPLQLDELLWSGTGFEADRALLRLYRERTAGKAETLSSSEKGQILAWLQWIYRANVQPTLQFMDTPDELVASMQAGELDWISCNATAVSQLRRKLGSHLGLALLPGGDNGEKARPMARLLLLGFGRDSNPDQRRMAESFALFVLNDFSQNNLMKRAPGNMPVNGNVIVPVKKSADLAVMEASLQQSVVPDLREGVGIRRRTEPLRQLIKQNAFGEKDAKQVLARLEQLAEAPEYATSTQEPARKP